MCQESTQTERHYGTPLRKWRKERKAQLAYSFDISFQNEFTQEENIALARQFLTEHFVSRGMVVDFAVHEPEKEEGGINNPPLPLHVPYSSHRAERQMGD